MATQNIGLLTAVGTTQGKIAASESKRVEGDLKFSDGVEFHSFYCGVVLPLDANRLVVAGRASLLAFSAWKPVDSTSPKWFQASANGEVFTKLTFTINKINAACKPQKFYEWDLTNAICSRFIQQMGDNNGNAEGSQSNAQAGQNSAINFGSHDLERLDFIYQTMTQTNLWANTVATYSMTGASK